MTKTKYWPMPDTGIKCPATTNKLKPCPIPGELKRNNFCHVHDPSGKQVQNYRSRIPSKKAIAAIAREARMREEIARDIEAECFLSGTSIECNCDFHRSAQIVRSK